ncbi:4-hydroxy-tetrahydrodipicolinate reductase [Pseudidiomarina sp.]|uniref:4-hydroxy-tetrahydrodipicolinate reductase n=1 Tax=Pseudidiomarina sp. TaxID=2081707 RepID=UPI003A987605
MKIGVIGASGRMGQAVLNEAQAQGVEPAAALVGAHSTKLNQETVSGLRFTDGSELAVGGVDVLIDFSLPAALPTNLQLAERLGVPLVVCTTGLDAEHYALLDQAAASIPVLYAANTSVGICLMEQLVQLASASLPDADIEITEAHHSAKRDAPSGTAWVLGEAAARGRDTILAEVSAGVRGDGLRQADSIGFSVIRAADIIGEHSVLLAQPGERIEMQHRVSDRRIFARGALQAAQWLEGQPAGRYRMADSLNLTAHLRTLLEQI